MKKTTIIKGKGMLDYKRLKKQIQRSYSFNDVGKFVLDKTEEKLNEVKNSYFVNFKLENKIDKIDETLERIEKSVDCLLILTFMDKGRITKRNSEFNKILDNKLNEILLKYQKKNNKSKENNNENKIININNQSKISANTLKIKKALASTNTHYSLNNRSKNIKNNKTTPVKYINKSKSLIRNSLIKNINPKYSQGQKKQFRTFKNLEENNARAKKIVFKKEIKPLNIKSNVPKTYFFHFSQNQLDSSNNSFNNNYQMNPNYSKDS